MRILSVDTSTPASSIALSDDGTLKGEFNAESEETHSVRLLPGIDTLLRSCGCAVKDVDVFAVVCGPGSFTGVRIGLTTIKGLAESLGKPVIPVTAFEAWVEAFSGQQGVVVPVIDARRDEIYSAVYRRSSEGLTLLSAGVVEKASVFLASMTYPDACFVGGGASIYKHLIVARPGWRVLDSDPFLARSVSRIAHRQAKAREFSPPAEVQAYYLRKPDAELKWRQ
ncbi:MAG: tRNA (adenosine(37)-N6)-threonylcarbamoyltransferase complex dimerization subunit type 1 TsaB [Acidimicrobiia bacterium]|nr:tRNA (adenosine(37)-N6)-threonylcarbamoyltransferase complex dimerization subunit type 1 TsaB [Acidimicrobiia bacterium]